MNRHLSSDTKGGAGHGGEGPNMDKACVDGLKDLYEEVTQIPSFTGVLKADSPKGQIILKRLVAKALLASLFLGPTQAPTRSLTGIS